MRKTSYGKAPKSSCGSRKDHNSEEEPQKPSIHMELELLALRSKNSDLTRAYAKLSRDYSDLKSENLYLKNDWVKLHSEYKCTENAYKKLVSDILKCAPSFVEISNLLIKINDHKGIISESAPESKAVIQPVKPHTVNGTVLMNPTISLARMSGGVNEVVDEDTLPSTSSGKRESRSFTRRISQSDDEESTEGNQDEDEDLPNGITRRKNSCQNDLPENSLEASEMDDSDDEEGEFFNKHSLSEKRLSPIREESSINRSAGEVRIFLSRLSDQDMELGASRNNSRTSIEASVTDNTYLNIETTLIENRGSVGGHLSTSIMMFSPRGNSTRLETMSPYQKNDVTELTVNRSEIQSSVVSASSNIHETASRYISPIPTLSMSALGDIDKENSQLAILTEEQDESLRRRTKMTPVCDIDKTVSQLASLTEEVNGFSSMATSPPSDTINVRTRSSRRQAANQMQNSDSSPLSARSSNVPRQSANIFVCNQRGSSSESVKKVVTPTVVLEKLEHMKIESALLPRVLLKENEKPKNNAAKKNTNEKNSKAGRSRSKSPKMPAKRSKTTDTIRDMQIRLSNGILPDSRVKNDDCVTSVQRRSPRPHRAARPKELKDMSLKCKMRRMF